MSEFNRLEAPWTTGEVLALIKYQTSSQFHPYTCPNHESLLFPYRGSVRLIPTYDGWVCSIDTCGYTQNWAHFDSVSLMEKDS